MGLFSVKRDVVGSVDAKFGIDRRQVRVLGFHVATLYRYNVSVPEFRPDQRLDMCHLHMAPLDELSIGFSLPLWLQRYVGPIESRRAATDDGRWLPGAVWERVGERVTVRESIDDEVGFLEYRSWRVDRHLMTPENGWRYVGAS